MNPAAEQSKISASKPGTKPDAKDDLKSLPMADVEKKLQSSPDGSTDAEAEKASRNTAPTKSRKRRPISS